ncbi:hypothetical protein [Sphingorhabdus sp. M41]|uniref:hypothetical protein n=1 Tax=Sphingorhabdus sp. M41 TaxID=1806885 RepID=UPI00078ECC37|nr:hypothetical protein [Sphingorhabdus sp. M41]AMO72611.1 hypothetical protein AZE99_12800 [Sphingorhabdus sp. M41]
MNLTNGLIGLGLLTGNGSLLALGQTGTIETRAMRDAKKAFNLAPTTPPWAGTSKNAPVSVRVSQIMKLASLIDSGQSGSKTLPEDVQTSFVAFKALDRLKLLADAAMKAESGAVRGKLDAAFQRGLVDLKTYLSDAPSDKVTLAFGQVQRRFETLKIDAPPLFETLGKGLSKTRDAPLADLTGQEVFTLSITRGTQSSQLRVDLAAGPQPPTLDSVADLINATIANVKMTLPDGSIALDENGEERRKWETAFIVTKETGSWGLKITTPGGEQVSMDQENSGDSLVLAAGLSRSGSAEGTRVMRLDNPVALDTRMTIASLSAIDSRATALAVIEGSERVTVPGVEPAPTTVAAAFSVNAVVTANDGGTYLIGTTEGEIGTNRLAGERDLVLTRLSSEGAIVWQKTLGTKADVTGAAISLAPNGDIVIAGTARGNVDGTESDGDMLVARFNSAGRELSTTLIRAIGQDAAHALTVGNDGSIYVAGQTHSGADATIIRIDPNGVSRERRLIDSNGNDKISALAIAGDGSLLALTREGSETFVRKLAAQDLTAELGVYALGDVDARVLAISDDGRIAVGGATTAAINGVQANSLSGGRDGFVARIEADMSAARISYIGTAADDQVDSLTFLNGDVYAGGRTTGDLAGPRAGSIDGYVARLDSASGAVASRHQVGLAFHQTGPLHIAAAPGGDNALGALGLQRGIVSGRGPAELILKTGLKGGESFRIAAGDGTARRIEIDTNETMQSLADKLRAVLGSNATVTTPNTAAGLGLTITPRAGMELTLFNGPEGRDALYKLGLDPGLIKADAVRTDNAPKIKPGGNFSLKLDTVFDLSTKDGAARGAEILDNAISMTKTAYRSLYWDDFKARLAEGGPAVGGGSVSPYLSAQLGRYQDALQRLGG